MVSSASEKPVSQGENTAGEIVECFPGDHAWEIIDGKWRCAFCNKEQNIVASHHRVETKDEK